MITFVCRNLDPLTETYGLSFYMQYLAHWPEYFQVAESPSGEIMGYSKFSTVVYFECSTQQWVRVCVCVVFGLRCILYI